MPYQETSVILDLFIRSYGRINVIAKGAKRPKSPLKGILTPAAKLSVSLSGKNDLKTLTSAEIIDLYDLRSGSSFNALIYINELISKATETEDPHKKIFDEYEKVLQNISNENAKINVEKILRNFELILLQEMGYGIDLTRDAVSNKEIEENKIYEFHPEKGFTLTNTQILSSNFYLGRDIKGFAAGDFEKKTTRDSSKTIMRKAIDYHLGNKQLNIRKYLSKK